jgi:hypothetical protein
MAGKPVLWIHEDALSPRSSVFERHPDAPAIFVFDEKHIAQTQMSFKRIVFLYECLLEMPVTIRRGDVVAEVMNFVRECEADCLLTMESVSPRWRQHCQQLSQQMKVQALPVEPFIRYEGHIDLKRFSRYWRVAEKFAFDSRRLF